MDLYMGKTLFISNIKYLGMVYWVKSDWFLGLITKGGHKSVKLIFFQTLIHHYTSTCGLSLSPRLS